MIRISSTDFQAKEAERKQHQKLIL